MERELLAGGSSAELSMFARQYASAASVSTRSGCSYQSYSSFASARG